jgi:hypothetical protein
MKRSERRQSFTLPNMISILPRVSSRPLPQIMSAIRFHLDEMQAVMPFPAGASLSSSQT